MRGWVTLLLFAGMACAQPGIHGTVRDIAGLPAAGVLVTATREGVALTSSRVTEEGGGFTFPTLSPGAYTLGTDRDAAIKHIQLDAGQDAAVDFTVPANSTISGRVLDGEHHPVNGAQVWLLKSEYVRGVLRQVVVGLQTTGANGVYRFDSSVQANRQYRILAESPHEEDAAPDVPPAERQPIEVPTYYPSAVRFDDAVPIVLQPGEQGDRLDITLAHEAYYCVDGKVRASGFTISETALAGTSLLRERGVADKDGNYRFCGLPSASYRMSSASGGSSEFTVRDADLHDVAVSAERAQVQLQVDWDVEPAYQLNAPADRSLQRLASTLGYGPYDLPALYSRLSNGTISSDPKLFKELLSLGRQIAEKDILALLDGVNYTVTVTLTNSTTGYQALVSARNPTDIPAGDYIAETKVSANRPAYAKEISYDGLKLADGTVGIAPGSAGTLHILLSSTMANLAVQVSDGDGKPVPFATVIVVPEIVTSAPLLARLGVNGYTSQPLPAGKYRVMATTQTVRWNVPEDLEKLLPLTYQGKLVELKDKDTVQITVEPVVIQ